MNDKRYFSFYQEGAKASIDIYGNITAWPYKESDVSSFTLSRQIQELGDVSEIEIRINSYGGSVSEGVAIYNALLSHQAKITTICDGFACSIASVIFMAGDERVMNDASLLMIHNASGATYGTAEEMRKAADDLDIITGLSKKIYLAASTLSADELDQLMDEETWITPEDAVKFSLATAIDKHERDQYTQNARMSVLKQLARPLTFEPRKEGLEEGAEAGAQKGAEPQEKGTAPGVSTCPQPEGTINQLCSFLSCAIKE